MLLSALGVPKPLPPNLSTDLRKGSKKLTTAEKQNCTSVYRFSDNSTQACFLELCFVNRNYRVGRSCTQKDFVRVELQRADRSNTLSQEAVMIADEAYFCSVESHNLVNELEMVNGNCRRTLIFWSWDPTANTGAK